jgi:hypothetical protein
MSRVWQIAGGPWGRSYADLFLRYGVGLIGPGEAGEWRPDRPDKDFGGNAVRRFATRADEGEIILLRSGTSSIKAIGLIASHYQYLPQFDDVNGWDLQHARRVRWCRLPKDHDFEQPVFGANPRRFGRVKHPTVVAFAQRFVNSPPSDWQIALLPPLPAEQEALTDIPKRVRDLVGFALDFEPHTYGERVSEDELICHLVVPLLRSLGWLPEQVAVKWRCVDVAVFARLPRRPENCRFIIEAKCPGVGAEGAIAQARNYARAIGVGCDLIVTDGFRYRLYAAGQGYQPVAYANLLRLKRNALELFERLRRP